MLYRRLLKPLLFRFPPDLVHDVFLRAGEELGRHWLTRELIDTAYGYHGADVSRTIDGIRYRTPVLLAAGFDHNAQLTNILPHVGFGGEEIGSVTARACAGNGKPRLHRLPRSRSILVNKGLRNDGVDAIIARMKRAGRRPSFVLGVSIARTNDALSAPLEAGIADYVYSFRRLNEESIGDFYTINISCPNAFGGEAFTEPRALDRLLAALGEIPCRRPVYVKMPLHLAFGHFTALLQTIDAHGLHGVVIGNLNKRYDALDVRSEAPAEYRGGLSGKPCTQPSTELIARTRQLYGRRFTIMGVGGILSPENALAKLNAGADLLQLITGMIFEGPSLMSDIARAIAGWEKLDGRVVPQVPAPAPSLARRASA